MKGNRRFKALNCRGDCVSRKFWRVHDAGGFNSRRQAVLNALPTRPCADSNLEWAEFDAAVVNITQMVFDHAGFYRSKTFSTRHSALALRSLKFLHRFF